MSILEQRVIQTAHENANRILDNEADKFKSAMMKLMGEQASVELNSHLINELEIIKDGLRPYILKNAGEYAIDDLCYKVQNLSIY